MAQALAGSQSAFEQIVRRYQRPIISLIARMTGDRALAEDLAQETFVKAFRSLAAFDTTRRLSSWLFRIAHNTALDALRRSRPPTMSIDTASSRSGDASDNMAAAPAADPVERHALGRALAVALGQLRPEFRAAIMLRYEEGLSFDEIGSVLGVPEVTARSHVHRARKELARHLTSAGWAPTATEPGQTT
ncbi:MAG: sigma-70 family RNA polymerase sigma factor [Acidobacteria bacterium]|nr:sigma-70 family RNA polymerase sigma factor [Acidobacteriota bacterium]MCA1652075.1 sigma-70 family RNA polymerase sigma factor [Acidobacteriota bacterium]